MKKLFALFAAAWLAVAPALATSVTTTGAGSAINIPLSFNYETTSTSTTNNNSYNFGSTDIGTADPTRIVVVGVYVEDDGGGSPIVTALTVGGISGTEVTARNGTTAAISLWRTDVPTDTTATVAISINVTTERCVIMVWTIYNADSATPIDSENTAAIDAPSSTLTTGTAGVIISAAKSTALATFTWTNITENVDGQIESVSSYTGASIATTTSSLEITATETAGNVSLVSASWQ